jgi:YHS domain-containing protein
MEHNKTSNSYSGGSPAKTACGGLIDNPERFPSAVYRGERVYFCALACLKVFEKNPDRFVAEEIEHPAN